MSLTNRRVLSPRSGGKFFIVIVARISTIHQDKRSLDDQIAVCIQIIEAEYPGPFNYHILRSQGSGEHLDRKELDELKDLIESGQLDVVIAEDLGRICRRNRAIDFCELCQDHETRLLAINDRVDTDEEGWEDAAAMATWHHSRSNRDTSNRIKRSLNNRFDQGQLMESLPYGYIRPDGATSDTQLSKDPDAEPIFKEMFRRLEEGATYSEIADWLNALKIPTGPYCRRDKWDCAGVSRLIHNRLLKGVRIHNRMVTKRLNKTGRHRSVKAPPEMLRTRLCPHLAFFDEPYYDHVIRLVDGRNAKYRRAKDGRTDTRSGVPRSRTCWPGQHLRCGICGRPMYWSKSGNSKAMFCSGAQAYACWNSLNVMVPQHLQKLNDAVLAEIAALPDFYTILTANVQQHLQAAPEEHRKRQSALESQLQTANSALRNIANALEKSAASETLLDRLQTLEAEKSDIEYQLAQAKKPPTDEIIVPTQDDLFELAREIFRDLIIEDQEAGRAMRRLIPEMYVVPYRCCDSNAIDPKLHFRLDLAALLPPEVRELGIGETLSKRLVINLFDEPQRVKYRAVVVARRALGHKERDIAADLGITQPAVQNAMYLHRQMQHFGLRDPYVVVTEAPQGDEGKLRRHRHPRFRFDPLTDFPLPW